MRNLHLDQFTKDQAEDYANTEAELNGFKIGSPQWKQAFKHYLSFAVGTISIGRNPRSNVKRNPRELANWPEVFSKEGFAGEVSKNFKTSSGTGMPLSEAQDRIKSAVTNLTYMFVNAVYGIRTTTRGRRQGKIPDQDMSDLQLRSRGEGLSEDEMKAQNLDVIYNQLALTVVETVCLECLVPFFKMTKDDVQEILDSMKINEGEKISAKDVAQMRTLVEKTLRARMDRTLRGVSVKDLILKN